MEQVLPDDVPVRVWHHRNRRRMLWRHRHRELELNLVLTGRAAYLCDDRRLDLAPGDLLFLHPGHDHLLLDESEDYRMWLAVWHPQVIAAAIAGGLDADAGRDRPQGEHLRRLAPLAAQALARLCADVAGADAPARASGGTYLLWRARGALQEAGEAAAAAVHPGVAQAARLLHDDPAQTVAALARAVGLSADHLERRFRAEMGLGLAAFRQRLRLDRAQAAMADGGDLTRVALDAGFNSYSAFHRAFRRRFGCGPQAWRTRDGA